MMFAMVVVNTKVVENFIRFPEYLVAWLLDLYNSSYDPNMKLASHLGTLDEPREGCDVVPNSKIGFGGSIPKMEGLSKC